MNKSHKHSSLDSETSQSLKKANKLGKSAYTWCTRVFSAGHFWKIPIIPGYKSNPGCKSTPTFSPAIFSRKRSTYNRKNTVPTIYSQTSLIRSSFTRIPHHPEENGWLQIYSIRDASNITGVRLSGSLANPIKAFISSHGCGHLCVVMLQGDDVAGYVHFYVECC